MRRLDRFQRAAKLIAAAFAVIAFAGCGTMTGIGEEVPLSSSTHVSGEYDLPAAAYGCWEGTIEGFDSITPLNWVGHLISRGMKTTYQMCYRHVQTGGGALTLNKVEIAGKEGTIVSFENHVTAVDAKRGTFHLRNHGVLEQVGYILWLFPVRAQQDIYAEQDIGMKNKDLVAMTGEQLVRLNGRDIARMTYHADFHRVPDAVPL